MFPEIFIPKFGSKWSPFYGLSYWPFMERHFWPFVKNGGPLDPNFVKRLFKIFDHEEDTVGIILCPISGL